MVSMGGVSRVDAGAKVDQDQAVLLPNGASTPCHHFFVAEVAGNRVGTLWLAEQKGDKDGSLAWVINIETEPAVRRRGHGRAVMLLAERAAKDLGHQRIALHVFAKNEAAIALYNSLGYRVTEVDRTGQLMTKDLSLPTSR